jgi:hypothetical protein
MAVQAAQVRAPINAATLGLIDGLWCKGACMRGGVSWVFTRIESLTLCSS